MEGLVAAGPSLGAAGGEAEVVLVHLGHDLRAIEARAS